MKIIPILLLLLAGFFGAAQQMMSEKSEVELIANLQNNDMIVRAAAAAEIRQRLMKENVVIKPGNIIEHTREYWEKLVKKHWKWMAYDTLEDIFGLNNSDRRPNYEKTKIYYLDHHFVLFVEQHKRKDKARVKHLVYSPHFYNDEPPQDFTGVWKIYDINGMRQRETNFQEGKKHGLDIIFHDNGTACWSKVFAKDSIMEMSHFSTTGKLISKEIFDDEGRARWERESEYEQAMQEK